MAPGKPEKLTNDAIKAVEKVAESKEEGAALAQQLREAHDSLDKALKQAQSLEEQLSLQIALKDIQDLERTLVERGKARKLTEKQRAELKELSGDLMHKVGNLDFIVDVVRFRDDFFGKISKRNKALAALSDEVNPQGMSPQFKNAAANVLKNSEDLHQQCYSYYENFNVQFGYDIPKEIQAEFEKMFAELVKLEVSDHLTRNSIQFAKLDEEFFKSGGKMESVNLENLQSQITALKNQGLVTGLKDYVDHRINQLAWNINIKRSSEEMDPKSVLARLKSEEALMQAQHYTKEFDEILSWLVSNILYSENKETLPTDSVFYKDLYALLSRRLQRTNLKDVLANGHIMASQIAVLASNTEHAAAYRPGVEIWHYKKIDLPIPDPAGYIDAGSSEEMDVARGSYRASDNDEWKSFGTIEKVDSLNGKVKLKDYDKVFDLAYFENSEYFFKEKGLNAYVAIVDIVNGSEKDKYLREAESNMKLAEVMTLKLDIECLNEKIKVLDAHVPRISLLRRFIDDGWVKIADGGKVSIHCPDENIEDVYEQVKGQFVVEEMYAQSDALAEIEKKFPEKVKEDPFFAARKLLVQAKIEMTGGQTYEARGSLVNFLDQMSAVKAERDDDMKNAEEFAMETLKDFARKSMERIQTAAGELFGHNEKYRNFLGQIGAMVQAEADRLEQTNDYKIDLGKLRVGHWRYDENRSTVPNARDYDMTGLVGLPVLLEEQARKYADSKVDVRNISDSKKWIEVYNEFFEENYPPVVEIETWNKLVALENPCKYPEMADGPARQSKFKEFADFVRNGHGRKVPRPIINSKGLNDREWEQEGGEIHPELAVMYYREAIGDEIKDAELALMHVRNKLVLKEKKEKRALYLAQAREEIEKELGSARLKSNFAGSGEVAAAILSDPKVLDAMAGQLVDRFVDEKIKMAVYKRFYDGRISGEAKDIWAKINDIEDPFDETWNWSDRTTQHVTEEFVLNAVIMAASFGVGEIITGGARLGYLALRGLTAARATEEATLAYRLGVLGTRTVNFTLAEKSIRSAFLKQNTWGSSGTDLSLNLAMFGGIGMGMHFWERTLGKELVGAAKGAKVFETRTNLGFAESPLYQGAAGVGERGLGRLSWGQMGLRGANWLGRFGTEGAMFTGMGVGQKLTIGEMKWDDINMSKEFGMNLLTILSLRAGNILFEPVFRPVIHTAEVKARRMVEDADHSVFLKNSGFLKSDGAVDESFFAGARASNKSPEKIFAAEKVLMDELRSFRDRHSLADDFFRGKSLDQIRQVMKKVSDFMKTHGNEGIFELPSREDLMNLYRTDKDVFAVIAGKLNVWPLELADAKEMYKNNPDFIMQFAGRLPKFRKWILRMTKEQAKINRNTARELEEGITASGEVIVDPLMETLLNGPEGFERGLSMIRGMDHLTLSVNQLLYVTSKVSNIAARELFLKTCSAKMSPIQRMLFEEAVMEPETMKPEAGEKPMDRADGERTILQVLRDFANGHSRWLVGVMRSAVVALAIKSTAADFATKPNKPAATWVADADLSKLPEAREAGKDGKGGSESVLFSPENPGRAIDAGKALESAWKAKTQDQLCSEMAEQGLPNDLINGVKVQHSELNPDLQRFVKILIREGANGELEPYVLVDQEGMQAEFGLSVTETKNLLKLSGVLMPENLLELAKQAGVSPGEMASISGVKEADLGNTPVQQAGLGFHVLLLMLTGGTGHILWGGWKLWKWTRDLRQDRRIGKLEDGSKKGGGGGGGGGDGKLPEGPKAKAASLPAKLEDVLKEVLDGSKLTDKLDATQIAALQKAFDEFKAGMRNFLYIEPEANIEAIGKVWMKIQYLELRLQKLHGVAVVPAGGRTVAEIEAEIGGRTEADIRAQIRAIGNKATINARLAKLRTQADIQTDLSKKGVAKDVKDRLNKELEERKGFDDKVTDIEALEAEIVEVRALIQERAAVTKPAQAGEETADLIKELNAAYSELLGLHTGAVDVANGTKKSLVRRGVKGKVEADIAPTATDLTPDEIRIVMAEMTDLLKHSGDFKRLKELEIALLLGAKKHAAMEAIVTASDPTNPQLESAKAYEAFYKKLLADRDTLCASTHGIMGGALLRAPGIRHILASNHPVKYTILVLILITLSAMTGYNLFTSKKNDRDEDKGDFVKKIEKGHKDIDKEGADEAIQIILDQTGGMGTTPKAPIETPQGPATDGSSSDQPQGDDQPAGNSPEPGNYVPRPGKDYQRRKLRGE